MEGYGTRFVFAEKSGKGAPTLARWPTPSRFAARRDHERYKSWLIRIRLLLWFPMYVTLCVVIRCAPLPLMLGVAVHPFVGSLLSTMRSGESRLRLGWDISRNEIFQS